MSLPYRPESFLLKLAILWVHLTNIFQAPSSLPYHTIWTPGINLRDDTQWLSLCLVYSLDSPRSYLHVSFGVESFHVKSRHDCTCSHTSVFDAVRVKYRKGTYSVTIVTSIPWDIEGVLDSWPCYELHSSVASFEEIWEAAAKRSLI